MPRDNLRQPSAARVELDQRSREARLRLERIERLLAARLLPKQSLLRRVLYYLRSRIYAGEQVGGGSTRATLTGRRPRQGRKMPDETGLATDRWCAAGPVWASAPISWPTCPKGAWESPTQLEPALATRGPKVHGEFPIRRH
jgi:hypothetical protein